MEKKKTTRRQTTAAAKPAAKRTSSESRSSRPASSRAKNMKSEVRAREEMPARDNRRRSDREEMPARDNRRRTEREGKHMSENDEVVTLVPAVDIINSEDKVTLIFEVPGANCSTIDIEAKHQMLTVTADSTLKRNYKPITYQRVFRLSDEADIENISADANDGVLTMCIPKVKRGRVHKIKVR